MNGFRFRCLINICFTFALASVFALPSFAQQEEKAEQTKESTEATQEESQEKPPAKADQWQVLSPKDSGFSVELPGEAKHSERTVKPLPNIEVKVNMYLLAIDGGKVAFVVGYHDVQEMPTTDKKRREILDGGLKGTIVNVLGKLVSHERGEIDGHKMLKFSYTGVRGQRDIIGDSQLILVGQRVYQLSIIRVAEAPVVEETREKFFSSFKLDQ